MNEMNDWMNGLAWNGMELNEMEWMNEMNERMNEWNGIVCYEMKWHHHDMTEWINGWMNEWMAWMRWMTWMIWNEMNVWINERMNAGITEWMNDWHN